MLRIAIRFNSSLATLPIVSLAISQCAPHTGHDMFSGHIVKSMHEQRVVPVLSVAQSYGVASAEHDLIDL